ncbi:MAG: glycerol kinase GlpK [Clostridiales bacterium]|jgi:glycerol kinase|nr:glycerol kinase GlpK [Clostridiales bacterium]
MEKKYILSIDQGTTSSRAILFDKAGGVLAQSARKHEQIYPAPGHVSHNAKEILFNVLETTKTTISGSGIDPAAIAALGLTNQRETVVLWDKATGEPVCDAIVLQCRRTSALCQQIITDGFDGVVREKTGLLPDPYFSATKIKWMLENVPAAKALLAKNRLLTGTVDSFILWHITEGHRHVTDYTNAARTMLFNIHTLEWDAALCDYFSIPREILPAVVPSSGVLGYTKKELFGAAIPVAGVAGDQHAALFGQTCFEPGDMKNTYGTGCFILANTGGAPAVPGDGLLSTIAWHIGGKTAYALEGSVFCAGAAIEWLIHECKLISDIGELDYILEKTADSGGVYFVPAFSGLSAPVWDMRARGAVFGMSLQTNRDHIVRAVAESIAYQAKDVLDYMASAAGFSMTALKADGGICKNPVIMQFQADMLGIPVACSHMTETTALGAGYLAGLAVGFYKNFEELQQIKKKETFYYPKMSAENRKERVRCWKKAIERTKGWLTEI